MISSRITKKNNLSLKSNVIWAFVGNVIYAMSQWGILITLTKFGTPEMVGQYALGLAITAPFFVLLSFNLRVVMVTDKTEQYRFNDYLTLRILMMLISFIFIIIISPFLTNNLLTLFVVLQVGILKVSEFISDIFHGIFQKVEKLHLVSISKIIKGVLSLIIVLVLIYLTENILITLTGLIISWVLILIIYDYRMSKKILGEYLANSEEVKLKWSYSNLKRLAAISFPLGIVAALDTLNVNIPRYFIQGSAGEEMLGYFAAITYLMVVGSTIINALGQAVTPRLSLYFSQGKISLFRTLLNRFIMLSIGIGLSGIIVATFFGEITLTLIYSFEYAQFNSLFIWVMVSAAIWYITTALGTGLNATRNFKAQIPIYILMVIFSTLASILLIPIYQIDGAAMAICVGMLVRLVASYTVLQKHLCSRSKRSI
ncbi:Membrane protein involved in the export of O-antigen and teichoic acid [Mesobacillus persicus]|uniref:Membrane protein involved in the export of O-antigen and teichoic acid n=1 Tax=Mesobacillus persicus TaxID=930146 RepID=A0A1H8GYW0_9BACI|nr:Membrane protein involved in the export of O-antigen and teichoic acid [Mesobacillus persicus]